MQRFFQRRFQQRTTPGNKRIRILTSFTPVFVRIVQRRGTNRNVYEWYRGMSQGSAWQILGSSGIATLIATNGITVQAPDKEHSGYIELGSASAFQVVDGLYIVQAWGDDGDVFTAENTGVIDEAGLDLDADSDRVGTIPSDAAASFVFNEGDQNDVEWIQREA